ncbi:MAG: hypothetical protein LBF61_01035 [Azoarcus sp.]|nr:hypothetical protein [Azoarcus sp.]
MARKKSVKEDSSGELFAAKTDVSLPWRLASNHQNLSYMLAAGLLMGPRGFGGRYYADSLSRCPGWILLFRGRVPRLELEYAVRENPATLKAAIATLDLHDLEGPVRIIARGGGIRDGVFPRDLQEEDNALLVRAPLPVNLVEKLSFSFPEDKKTLEDRVLDVSNVELALPLEVDKTLFAADTEDPQSSLVFPAASADEDRPPVLGQVTGGILAMLYHMANRGETSVAAFRTACGQAEARDADWLGRDPILAELASWLAGGKLSARANIQARLFWGVVDAIIEARRDGSPLRPIEQTLAFLENQLGAMEDERYRPRLERLLQDMRQAVGFLDNTVTELLERHKGSLSRPLLLFCLRESCEELLEFSHPFLSETEFLLAAILFGARDGWLGLPRALRQPARLSTLVAHRMARVEQGQNPTPLRLSAPERPKPLRELFLPGEKGWSRKQQEAALELARKCKWTEAIQTRITLDKGDYRVVVGNARLEILIEGDVKAVATETDMEKILQRIAASSPGIEARIEKAVRELLGA